MTTLLQSISGYVVRTLIKAPFGFGEPLPSENWDRIFRDDARHTEPATAEFAAHALQSIRQHGIERPRILDLGCGPGQVLSALPPGSFDHYMGVDCSPEALRRAASSSPHPPETASFILADFDTLPATGTHDLILARESLYYARRLGALVRRFSRTLSDEGVWVISMHATLRNRLLWRTIERSLQPFSSSRMYNAAGQPLDVRSLRRNSRAARRD
jgi:trans-aconitate methyltransferase